VKVGTGVARVSVSSDLAYNVVTGDGSQRTTEVLMKRTDAWFKREARVAYHRLAAVTRAATFNKIAKRETEYLPHESEDRNDHIQRIFDYFEKVHLGIAKDQ
jgi:hypothetical protein